MPVSPVGSRSPFSLAREEYPDPFLDVASTKLPKSQKKLLELLYIFGTTHPQISPIVKKLAKYPITKVIVTDEENSSSEVEKKWKRFFENKLSIYEKAEAMGLDFFGYGNCFIVIHHPFIRYYKCKRCKENNVAGTVKYYINNKKIVGKCPKCKKKSSFKPRDEKTQNAEDISIVRIPPQEMHIKSNDLTGKAFYYRRIPKSLKNAIKGKKKPDREIIDSTPWKYVKAALKKKKIKYKEDKILHLKEPSMSGKDLPWGKPIIMAALKDAYLNQVYKKADESVANERTVPARFVYPQPSGNDPMRTISLSKFGRFMGNSIKRWRQDKNAVMVSPFPVGVAEVGGDAQRLSTANLRQLTIKEIIGSTGVPEGFLADGMTWSGGSVQLRMLENMIMGYKRALDRLVWFVADTVKSITDWPEVSVKFKPFKMADDVQKLQILIQLAQMKHVSFKEVLERLDLNWEEEHEKVKKETKKVQEIQLEESMLDVKSMLKSYDYQVETQNRQSSYQELVEDKNQFVQSSAAHLQGTQEFGEHEEQMEEQKQQQQMEEQQQQQRMQEAEIQKQEAEASQESAEAMEMEEEVAPVVRSIIEKIQHMPPEQQEVELEGLRQTAPSIAQKVEQFLQMLQQQQQEQQQEQQMQQEQQPQPEEGEEQSIEGIVEEIRMESKNPEEMADKIIMLPGPYKEPAFDYLSKSDPQLGLRVQQSLMEKFNKGKKKSSPAQSLMDQQPKQKPPRSN